MPRVLTTTMLAAMRGSHRIASQMEVLISNTPVLSTESTNPTQKILVVGGDVSWDSTRALRGQANVEVLIDSATDYLIPTTLTDAPLNPLRAPMLRLRHGFVTTAGTETVLLGDFDVSDVEIVESAGGVIMNLTAYDRLRRMQRDTFTALYTIAAGTNVVTALKALVVRTFPSMLFTATATTYTTPQLVYQVGDDPLAKAQELAASIGFEVFLNYLGVCIIRPLLTAAGTEPNWTLVEDTSDTKMLTGNRTLSNEEVYNGVVMRGESFGATTDPVSATVWDTDTLSPTYYDPAHPTASTYGPHPKVETSEYVTTTNQATDAAQGRLLVLKGLSEKTALVTRVNPGIEVGDLVQIERARTGLSGSFLTNVVGFGLRASGMALTCRERRL